MHKKLEEQLKQFLSTNGPFPPGWDAFTKAVSDSYAKYDEEKVGGDRSIEIASQELNDKNQNLRASLESANLLEQKLIQEKASVEEKVKERTKQFNEEAARLQSSINSLNIGLIMTDIHNKVLTMNMAAKSILLSRPNVQTPTLAAEILSTSTLNIDVVHLQHFFTDILDLVSQIDLCMEKRRSIEIGEVNYGRKVVLISLRPILSNETDANKVRGILGVVIVIQDITEQKTIERSKDEFFSIASHELRTPLTAIRGNSSLIQQYYGGKLQDPMLKEMINDIHESSVRLIGIVNDFLDTSRLEMGRMQFKREKFDLTPLVQSVIKEYVASGSMKHLYLRLEEPQETIPLVIGDQARLKQVVINLVGNALKFTSVGGITLKMHVQAGQVVLGVSDTGKGIPAQNHLLLFRKFQQAGSSLYTRDEIQGTGLGLYISHMMMQGMGGAIWLVSSEEGKGTTFALSLPAVA